MAPKSNATSVDELEIPPADTDTTSKFWSFTDEEPPEDDSKRAKYDSLIALCFANPEKWAKLTRTFTSNATANNLRKRYAEFEGPNGEAIEVRAVRVNDLSGKPSYEVYVRATQSDVDDDEDTADDEAVA